MSEVVWLLNFVAVYILWGKGKKHLDHHPVAVSTLIGCQHLIIKLDFGITHSPFPTPNIDS